MSENVVSLTGHREALLDARWLAYQQAATKAQSTLKQEDGIAAGKAWRAWLDLFMTSGQSSRIGILPGRGTTPR